MSAGSRFSCCIYGYNKSQNLLILLLFGFVCAVYVGWHGLAVMLDSVQQQRAIGRSDSSELVERRRGVSRFIKDVQLDAPLNIEFQSQIDHSLPEVLHSLLSSRPFSSMPLLPLNTSIIDRLFENIEIVDSDVSSGYEFGILPAHWPFLLEVVTGDRFSEQQCRLIVAGAWCLGFRCLSRPAIDVFLYRLHNESRYWTTRTCGDHRRLMGLPMFKLSAHLTSYNVTILLPHDLRQYRAALRHARFLTCDYRSADAYRRKYGKKADANTTVVTFVPEASIANLADLRDVLHTLRMTPFLCGGTLLGWRRECGIIPYTSDFDFCVPISQYNAGLEAILANHAHFTLKYRFGKPSDSLEYTVIDRGGVRIDIFFLYEGTNHSWVGGMGPGRMKLKYTYPKVSQLCSVDLLGHLFHVPCNVDDFITADYDHGIDITDGPYHLDYGTAMHNFCITGPNWTQPIHQDSYVWYYSPHSVSRVGYWPEKEAKEVEKTFN